MDIEKLIAKRKGLRKAFTLCSNKIRTELLKENPDIQELSVLETQFKDKFDRLSSCQDEVENANLQSADYSEKIYEDDLSTAEGYRDNYYELISKIKRCVIGSKSESSPAKDYTEKRQFKLPKIELKKFNGEAKEFLSFWAQFEKIHNDTSLPAEDKFQYLLQAVVPKSKAAKVVESFPATAANYPKAVQQLRDRFGRDDLLVQIYVRDLLSMVMKNATSARSQTDLPTLYDDLETKLRALESLGRTQEKYGDFLTPLVESCLPENILIAWERNRNSTDPSKTEDRSLNSLMSFLKQEVQGEEMVLLARSGFGANPSVKKKELVTEKFAGTPSTAALISMTNQGNSGRRNFNCLFCDKSHFSQECFMARNLSLEDKKKILIRKGACFCCLRTGHTSRSCKSKNKCIQCNRNHYILMCPDRELNIREMKPDVIESKTLSNNCNIENVLLMTLALRIRNRNYVRTVRAIVDTGSQRSYLSNRIIRDLKLKPKCKQKLIHGLFGGNVSKPCVHDVYEIKISNIQNTFSIDLSVLSEDKICGFVPRVTDTATIEELKDRNLILTDLSLKESEIDLLLGADVAGSILTGVSMKLNTGLIIIETKFGYTLIGKENVSNEFRNGEQSVSYENNFLNIKSCVLSLHSVNFSIRELWELDAIGIRDPCESDNRKLMFSDAMDQFQNSLTILPDGRYEVSLPFKNEISLPSNSNLTLKRHKKMCKRAANEGYLDDYISIFKEWEKLEIIEKIQDEEVDEFGHYLPHRPVIKENSQTSKIRPVFDASAKEGNQPSLNDILTKGPNLIELIPDIMDRFRLYPIGLSADIEKAFLQLSIDPQHRNFLRFFFPSETEEIIYRHRRVVFGVTTSPFLLMASLNHLLENVSEEYSDIVPRLRHSFYVDNFVTGVFSLDELEQFVPRARNLLKGACFNLRNWESNMSSSHISKSTGDTSLLGMIWNLDRDTLRCLVPRIEFKENQTKRVVLSLVQQIFDPLGILCPATLLPKLLMQETWRNKLNWDSPLPDDMQKSFSDWLVKMPILNNVEIPRYLDVNETSELHVFVDACKKSYGACVFMRTEVSLGVKIRLLRAKSRVAPLKELSIPKLELMSCCIGARLAHSIIFALDLSEIKVTFWCDSMVALWWIRERGEWSVFVSNRVREIHQLTSPESWRHVPGDMNIADVVSRGCLPEKLTKSQWWEGPSWLLKTSENWPSNEIFRKGSRSGKKKSFTEHY